MKVAAVALVLLSTLAVACGTRSSSSTDVVGTWRLTAVALPDGSTVPISATSYAWFAMGDAGDGSGRDGTNNFTLHYLQSGGTLRFTDVAITAIGLGPSAPREVRASAAGMDAMLAGRDVVATRDGAALVVTVPDAGGKYVLTFEPKGGGAG